MPRSPRPTVADWLERAARSSTTADRDECLDRASREVSTFHARRALLRALAAIPTAAPRLGALEDEVLQGAVAEGEVWGFRTVARVRAARGDAAGARRALEAGASAFDSSETPGYRW